MVLLHGWTATADLNWFTCYKPLAEHYRVVALDHRGHGRGIRSRKAFRLEDCADDAVAVCDVLGIEQFIPVGYSMGGPIAQLIWQRHRQRTAGSGAVRDVGVLLHLARGATELPRHLRPRRRRQAHAGAGSAVADRAALPAAQGRTSGSRGRSNEAASHDWRAVLEAGRAIGNFSSREWISEIDVPTSTVITMRDRVVPVRRQVRLFEAIPDAEAFRVDGDHDVVRGQRRSSSCRRCCARVARSSNGRDEQAASCCSLRPAVALRSRSCAAAFAASRNLDIAALGVQVGGTYATTAARKLFASAERRVELDRERELRTAEAITERLGNMKGALMKLGQMASYVSEGLPEPMRAALAELQSNAPPMSAELAAGVIERELGAPPDKVFVEWDPDPIASASIGQVHRAVVVDPSTGLERAVAVKVQYPGVGEAIEADLRNASLLGADAQAGVRRARSRRHGRRDPGASRSTSSTTRWRPPTSRPSPTSTAATRSSMSPMCWHRTRRRGC